ncbi:hypothetical protein F2P56_005828, partial [Juglans regia]
FSSLELEYKSKLIVRALSLSLSLFPSYSPPRKIHTRSASLSVSRLLQTSAQEKPARIEEIKETKKLMIGTSYPPKTFLESNSTPHSVPNPGLAKDASEKIPIKISQINFDEEKKWKKTLSCPPNNFPKYD